MMFNCVRITEGDIACALIGTLCAVPQVIRLRMTLRGLLEQQLQPLAFEDTSMTLFREALDVGMLLCLFLVYKVTIECWRLVSKRVRYSVTQSSPPSRARSNSVGRTKSVLRVSDTK